MNAAPAARSGQLLPSRERPLITFMHECIAPLSKMDMQPCTSSRGLQGGRPCSVLQTKAPLEQAILPRCHSRQLAKVIYYVPVISNQQDWVVIVERQLG